MSYLFLLRKSNLWLLVLLSIIFSGFESIAQTSKPVLSSRWHHPIDRNDSLNTLSVIEKFKITQLDWTYCDDPTILEKYRSLGVSFSLALNPMVPDSADFTTKKTRIITLEGKPYHASWMKQWQIKNPYWGCVNNPLFKQVFLERAIKLIQMKPYALFVDDPLFNVQLQNEIKSDLGVGCVCQYCLAGFRKYMANKQGVTRLTDINVLSNLKKDIKNLKAGLKNKKEEIADFYRNYQRQCVIKFLTDWKAKVLKYNTGVKILGNNYRGEWNDIYTVLDGGIAELPESDLNTKNLDSKFKIADNKGKSQLFTLVSRDENAHFYLIAYLFLNHRNYLIPWDIFAPIKSGGVDRYNIDLNKFNDFIQLLEQKNTVIKRLDNLKTENGNKWYKIEYDKDRNVNYILLKNDP